MTMTLAERNRARRKHLTCTEAGCGGPHHALGYCQKHYLRLKAHGSTAEPRRAPTASTASHGTRSRYVHGCRCGECRHASKIYQRIRRLRAAWGPIFAQYIDQAA